MEHSEIMEAIYKFKAENDLSWEGFARVIGSSASSVWNWRQGSPICKAYIKIMKEKGIIK